VNFEPSPDGKTLHSGGVYLTFSGDEELPYSFAKIIQHAKNDLWVKLYRNKYENRPTDLYSGDHVTLNMSVDMFLAWGPPDFPVLIIDEPISEEEIAQCKDDYRRPTDQKLA
jgi:hypothetical protein